MISPQRKGCGEVEGGYHCRGRVVERLRVDITTEEGLRVDITVEEGLWRG